MIVRLALLLLALAGSGIVLYSAAVALTSGNCDSTTCSTGSGP